MKIHEELKDIASQEILDKIPEEKIDIINKFWENENFPTKLFKRIIIATTIEEAQEDIPEKYEYTRYNYISPQNFINKYYNDRIYDEDIPFDEDLIDTLGTKYNVNIPEFFKLYFETLTKEKYPESLGEFHVCTPYPVNIFWKRQDIPDKDKKAQAIINVFEHFNNYYEDGIKPYDFYEAYNYAS